jgi:hypothetical protein
VSTYSLSTTSVIHEAHHDVSPLPLLHTAPAPRLRPSIDSGPGRIPIPAPRRARAAFDPVVEARPAAVPAIPAPVHNFEGIGLGFTGPAGSFRVQSAPPDTNGAVGPNHFVQTTNTDLAVFDKGGAVLYGPVQINTLWSGFGGGCQDNNDGDPVVQYDQFADRWIVSQFSIATKPFLQCVAVSTSGDPTGSYNRYSFSFGDSDLNDYPKIGVWPDAYYFTFNIFTNATTFAGARVCAYDRAKMLTGAAATAQCFSTSADFGGLLPANADGHTAPPAGSPNYVVNFGADSLNLWKLHIDWSTPASSNLNGPTNIAVAAFTPLCNGDTCVPQAGTTDQLDTLADRLMYRLAYRNFGDHESLVVNHTVDAGGGKGGVRWYELRNPNGTPSVFQQSTYAPDGNHRWMGSAAMDKLGNLAIGYSVSSTTLFPEIRYAGRLVDDPINTLSQGEASVIVGGGAQIGGLSRWGDYSSMSVDPTNDCTFWYTTEYLTMTGSFNWSTRIASFTFPSCAATSGDDFSLAISPSSLIISPGGAAGLFSIATAVTGGKAEAIALSVTGLPAGVTARFDPPTVTAGQSSTLTVKAAANASAANLTFTVKGTAPKATHLAAATLIVTDPHELVKNGTFEAGLTGWKSAGTVSVSTIAHTGSKSVQIGSTGPNKVDSTLVQSVAVPTVGKTTLTFWYQPHSSDNLTFDWQRMEIRNQAGKVLATPLNVCLESDSWTEVTADLTPYKGTTVQLFFLDHDDGATGDPTYYLLDDVSVVFR